MEAYMPRKARPWHFTGVLRSAVAFASLLSLFALSLNAQQAGVLLGYGAPPDHGGPGYKTAWIVFSTTEAHVVLTVPDIIVPRSSGFWRVGVYIACEYREDFQQDSAREVVWQTPLEKAPLIDQGPPCKSHKPGDVDNTEENAPGEASASTEQPDSTAPVNLCVDTSGSISFVSPTHLSEAFDDVDTCDPRGGHDQAHNIVRSLDSSKPLSLADVFADRAANAYSAAAAAGFAENSKDFNCPEPDPDHYDLTSWSIAHRKGSWLPLANLNQFMGECAFLYPLALQLPKSITGETPRPGLWKAFGAAVPHLADFFLSPLGDYALVVVEPKKGEFRLYAYSVLDGVPARQMGEIPIQIGRISVGVMAQWCSPKYLSQWSAVLQKIGDHPLPAPIPHHESVPSR
jgi:hypothetical protein